jgi:hypothetical protein
MSIEALLLLAAFILLPIIERMLRAARRPDGDTPDQGTDVPRPASRPSIPPPTPQRQPPTDARVSPPADVPQVPARPAPRRSPRPPRAAAGAPRAVRSGSRVEELHTPRALRRAVVLTTILGPCRAVAPYAWEGASGAAGQG